MPYDVYFKSKEAKLGIDFRFYHQFSKLKDAEKAQTKLRSLGYRTRRKKVRQ